MKKQKVKRKSETITINRKTYDNSKGNYMAHSEGFGIGWEKRQGKTFTSTDWLSNGKQQTRGFASEVSVSRDEIKLKQDAIEGLKKMIVNGIKEEVKAQMEQEKPKPW